jgi:GPH family glycoside/pentoside/hexuronide:cation symporter
VSDTSDAPRLGLGAKFSYGLGSVAQGSAGAALAGGTITYYLAGVMHLPPAEVGALVLVSLVADAILDPVIGRISDGFRSRWGRRHPFMYASALPVSLAMYLFWNPPHGLSGPATAAFALAMLVVLRISVSLYEIPSTALTPELAPDYHERTDLLSFRWFFGIAGAVGVGALLGLVFVRQDAAHPKGMLDPVGYGHFGLFAAVVTFLAILISSLATHRYIPRLKAPAVRRLTTAQSFREIVATLSNPSLVVVILSGLISGVAGGITSTLSPYMSLHFWMLKPQVMGGMALISSPLSLVGIVLAPLLSRLLDKKRTMITVFVLSIFTGVVPVSLRLLGLMPPNGSIWVPIILMADLFVSGTLGLIGFIIIGSMVADVAEDAAVKTGVRSEGLLFAANGLLPKVTGGIGALIGGLLLAFVHFPVSAMPGTVDPSILHHLVLISLPLGVVLSLTSTLVLIFYRIDKGAHERNLAELSLAPSVGETPLGGPVSGIPPIEPRPVSPSV